MKTIRTWAASKNSDLYTKPGLDTGVKNSQIWRNAEKNKYDYFNIQVKKIILT